MDNVNDVIICDKVGIKFEKRASAPTIADWWDSKFSRAKNGKNSKFLWALRNVSFSVKKGEMVGLIGKNGAGKSTLLRVVAQILPPDEGNIQVQTECHLLARGVGNGLRLYHIRYSSGTKIFWYMIGEIKNKIPTITLTP